MEINQDSSMRQGNDFTETLSNLVGRQENNHNQTLQNIDHPIEIGKKNPSHRETLERIAIIIILSHEYQYIQKDIQIW